MTTQPRTADGKFAKKNEEVDENPTQIIEIAGGQFELKGKCTICGENLYGHIGGVPAYEAIGNNNVSYVKGSGMLCQKHYLDWLARSHPMAYQEISGAGKRTPDGSVVDRVSKPGIHEIGY